MTHTKKTSLTTHDIALIGMMIAVIEVSKQVLSFLPNVELTTFWIILFTLYFGKRIFFVIPAFVLIEGFIYGIHIWWIMYLYTWPILACVIRLVRKSTSVWTYSIISGLFGLLFGFLCSFPYFFIGAAQATPADGLHMAFAWWVSGIPWDLVHGCSNFILMLVLYKPVTQMMKRIQP